MSKEFDFKGHMELARKLDEDQLKYSLADAYQEATKAMLTGDEDRIRYYFSKAGVLYVEQLRRIHSMFEQLHCTETEKARMN